MISFLISTNRSNGQQSLVLILEEGRIMEREKLFNRNITADATVTAAIDILPN